MWGGERDSEVGVAWEEPTRPVIKTRSVCVFDSRRFFVLMPSSGTCSKSTTVNKKLLYTVYVLDISIRYTHVHVHIHCTCILHMYMYTHIQIFYIDWLIWDLHTFTVCIYNLHTTWNGVLFRKVPPQGRQ